MKPLLGPIASTFYSARGLKLDRAARTLSIALSMLLLANAAHALVSTSTISGTRRDEPPRASAVPSAGTSPLNLSLSDSAASRKVAAIDVPLGDHANTLSLMSNMKDLVDLDSGINANFDEMFCVEAEPIVQQSGAVDIGQIQLAAADAEPAITGRYRRLQDIATLELMANGLGSTSLVKSNRFSSSGGLSFNLTAISVGSLGTGLISLAFLMLRRYA
jgi:hypothetical protein